MPPRTTSLDPRSIRVQAQLKAAALALVSERRIETISVSEIAQQAGVSRQVFYQHFVDCDDVVASAMIDSIRAAVFVADEDEPLCRIHRLVDCAMKHDPISRNLRPSAASERLSEFFQELLVDICAPLTRSRLDRSASSANPTVGHQEAEAMTAFLVGGLQEVIKFAVNCSESPGGGMSTEAAHRMVDHCLEWPWAQDSTIRGTMKRHGRVHRRD